MSDSIRMGQPGIEVTGPPTRRTEMWRYGAAIGLVVFASLLTYATERAFAAENVRTPFAFFYAAVVIATIYFGRNPGLISALLSAFSSAFFFLSPGFSLAIGFDGALRLCVFLFVALLIHSVTEKQQRAEAGAVKSEERYRELFENANDIIYTLDLSGNLRSLNKAGEIITGYRAEELLGKPITQIIAPQQLEMSREMLERKLAGGEEKTSYELDVHAKDGRTLTLEISSRLIYEHGRPAGIQGIARNVTERKQVEEALRESETRYRYLADAMPQIVWTARSDGYLDYYNRRWFEYTGLTLEQTRGWGWQPAVHPEDLERCLRAWAVSVERGRNYSVECRFRRASDQSYRWHLARAEPMRDREGKIVRWFGTATDIHDRKQTEETIHFLAEASALLASTLDYETILERVASLSVSTLADYCLIDVVEEDGGIRRVATAHTDMSKEELVRALRKYPPDPEMREGISQVLRTGEPLILPEVTEEKLRAFTRNEEHATVLLRLGLKSFMTVPLPSRERTLGALTLASASVNRHYSAADLSFAEELARRAALAIENAHLYKRAQEANKAKDEFLATLSHELRTPLTPIMGWVHMMRSGRLQESEVEQGLNVIEKNSQALTRLINDLLDMSSIMSGKMRIERESVRLAEVIQEAVETVRPLAAHRDVRIETSLCEGGDNFTISGDRTRLVQVFWNLLHNAVKFSGDGGNIRVECVRSVGGPDEVRVDVLDEGQGIPEEFQPYVFERFRQADGSTTREHGGLGIGLALVKSFVEAHGGTASVSSAGVGRGSRFSLTFPLLRARLENAAGGQYSPLTPPRPDTLCRVLIVEDARDTLDMLRVIFETRGFSVTGCETAAAALRVASSMWFDIVVSDIGLPQIDGYELIRRLRELPHLRDVPAVALTGYAAQRDVDSALAAGFDAHIPKPVDPAMLSDEVERLLREKTPQEQSEA